MHVRLSNNLYFEGYLNSLTISLFSTFFALQSIRTPSPIGQHATSSLSPKKQPRQQTSIQTGNLFDNSAQVFYENVT